jgi:cytochrome P450
MTTARESYDVDALIAEHADYGCPVVEVDAYGPAVAADPHPFYATLRDKCPVAGLPFGDGKSYMISRHEDVTFALRNPDIFSSDGAVDIGQERPLIPLEIDPPDHVKWRRLMDPHLAPKRVAPLEDDIRELVNEIIDTFADEDHINFHEAFSVPVPCIMFLRLLGLPTDEMDRFVRWKDNIIRPLAEAPEAMQEIRRETGQEMYAYFRDEIDSRRSQPRDDLLSEFTHSEVDGRPLTDHEILDILFLFLLGGLDTVTASLDCTISHLASHPDSRQQMIERPETISTAIEEFLRFHTPVMGIVRRVAKPVELHGVEKLPGDSVMVMIGSANVDETQFMDPHEMQLAREENKHYAFGGGPHRCLGSHFARLELRLALEEFHKRIPEYQVRPGHELDFSTGIREVADLPLDIVWATR